MQLTNTTDARSALYRAVVISLFTWRRAGPDDPVDDAERYGWWGDSYPRVNGDRIGSRLWLLRRRSITAQTLRDAEHFAREALQWMVDDGLALDGEGTVERAGHDQISVLVTINQAGGHAHRYAFNDMWQVIHAV
jgi:phage gp46-like protein